MSSGTPKTLIYTHMRSEATRGAIYNYINLILIVVTGMVLTPFVIRHLGASQYGLYSLSAAILPYLALLDMGMSRTITRYIARYRNEHDTDGEMRFLAACSYIYIAIILVIAISGAILYHYSNSIWSHRFTTEELQDVQQMIGIIIMAHVVIIPGNAFTAICNGSGLFAFPRAIQPIKLVLRVVGVIILLLCGTQATALIMLEMALSAVVAIATALYVISKRHYHTFSWQTATDLRPIIGYSGWIALYAITIALQWNMGTLVAGMHFDPSTVGIVGIGIMIGNIYGYIAETINRMTLPRATRLMAHNPSGKRTTDGMIEVGRLIAIAQWAVIGAFLLFGQSFLTLWAGESYQPAYYIALAIMLSWQIQQSQDFGNALIEASGEVRTLSVINFIAIFAGVIASYFASQCWGIAGLIGTLTGGTIVATIANNIYYRYRLHMQAGRYFTQVYVRLICATASWVTILWFMMQMLGYSTSWWCLLAGIALYLIGYVIITYTCVLTSTERQIVKNYVRPHR